MTAPTLSDFSSPDLEPAWESVLRGALGRTLDHRSLGTMVSLQAARYRGESVPLAPRDSLAARALFWLPRDLPKTERPIAELLFAKALPDRALRVLDLGAGLGASTLGALRTLRGRAFVRSVTLVDSDPEALGLGSRITEGAMREGLVERVPVETMAADLSSPEAIDALPKCDLALLGLTAVEITRVAGDEHARGAALAELLRRCLGRVADDGALVVIEPATREDSRALHRARAELTGVFAPCVQYGECPMLARERDWCHEDLAERGLPKWLVPVAKAAGLRWEGPTYAYLTLRNDGRTLRDALPSREGETVARVVSWPLRTKGKTEATLCGDFEGASGRKVMELDCDAKGVAESERLAGLARGDLVAVDSSAKRVTPGQWRRAGG